MFEEILGKLSKNTGVLFAMDINTDSLEGRLLIAAIGSLMTHSEPEFDSKSPDEILAVLVRIIRMDNFSLDVLYRYHKDLIREG